MADVSGALSDLEDYARDLRDKAGELVVNDTVANAPVSEHKPGDDRTPGTLRDSIELRDASDDGSVFSVTIIADTEYAEFTDTGSAPHDIIGRPTLTFWWEGGPRGVGFYTFRSVHHPGFAGYEWFAKPMPDRWESALQEAK